MFIQPVPCDSDAFSHGKGGYNGTNSKSFDMPETKSGEKYVGPCSKAYLRKDAGKSVGNTGNSGNSCPGIEHKDNAEAVDGNRKKKCKLSPVDWERFLCSLCIQVKSLLSC